VRRLRVERHVEFLGFREDISELYARSRVLVLPSRYDRPSIALLEAMARGLPVLASDVGEVAGCDRHGEHGFLYSPGDVAELSRRLSQLLDDPGLSHKLGQRGRRDAPASGCSEDRSPRRSPPGLTGLVQEAATLAFDEFDLEGSPRARRRPAIRRLEELGIICRQDRDGDKSAVYERSSPARG
jgi:hypothetical protein